MSKFRRTVDLGMETTNQTDFSSVKSFLESIAGDVMDEEDEAELAAMIERLNFAKDKR